MRLEVWIAWLGTMLLGLLGQPGQAGERVDCVKRLGRGCISSLVTGALSSKYSETAKQTAAQFAAAFPAGAPTAKSNMIRITYEIPEQPVDANHHLPDVFSRLITEELIAATSQQPHDVLRRCVLQSQPRPTQSCDETRYHRDHFALVRTFRLQDMEWTPQTAIANTVKLFSSPPPALQELKIHEPGVSSLIIRYSHLLNKTRQNPAQVLYQVGLKGMWEGQRHARPFLEIASGAKITSDWDRPDHIYDVEEKIAAKSLLIWLQTLFSEARITEKTRIMEIQAVFHPQSGQLDHVGLTLARPWNRDAGLYIERRFVRSLHAINEKMVNVTPKTPKIFTREQAQTGYKPDRCRWNPHQATAQARHWLTKNNVRDQSTPPKMPVVLELRLVGDHTETNEFGFEPVYQFSLTGFPTIGSKKPLLVLSNHINFHFRQSTT